MKTSGQKPDSGSAAMHADNVKKIIGTSRLEIHDLIQKSPVSIPTEPLEQFCLLLTTLFGPEECIELKAGVICDNEKKAVPLGNAVRHKVRDWIDLTKSGQHEILLGSRSGTFMRINAVEGSRPGSGSNGVTTDNDIAEHLFCLLEHDHLPKAEQAALLCSLPIPIAAIVDSGGQSLHAWMKINASCGGGYAEEVKALYSCLANFGFDPVNKNPSRLTRAPGFPRVEGRATPQFQSLLYLNPTPSSLAIVGDLA